MLDYCAIGKRLKRERHIRGLSQERVSSDMNLGNGNCAVSRIEKAEKASGITNLKKLEAFAEYYQISLPYLLFGEELNQGSHSKKKSS